MAHTDIISEMTDAEIKAMVFLSDMMGEKKYNKFIKDGKIEIKTGKHTYILDIEGKIINKTTKQSYCVKVLTDSFYLYPQPDVIAIRYCWVKYKSDIVDKVANKRNLDFIEIMEKIGDRGLFNVNSTNAILMMLTVILTMSAALLVYVIFK